MEYFIANWKANKDLQQADEWWAIFDNKLLFDSKLQNKLNTNRVKIIIAPPIPFLVYFLERIDHNKKQQPYYKNIYLSAQDISQFEEGTYTGEVTAKTLQGIVDYAIIGHSERIKNFSESAETNLKKINLALKYNINPLLCIQNDKTNIPLQVKFVVYEPPWAISKGYKDSMRTKIEETPENAVKVRQSLKINRDKYFIYGGSVNSNNIKEYSKFPEIDGVLVGGASLNPSEFYNIVSLT